MLYCLLSNTSVQFVPAMTALISVYVLYLYERSEFRYSYRDNKHFQEAENWAGHSVS
jgi:hypothetical protein